MRYLGMLGAAALLLPTTATAQSSTAQGGFAGGTAGQTTSPGGTMTGQTGTPSTSAGGTTGGSMDQHGQHGGMMGPQGSAPGRVPGSTTDRQSMPDATSDTPAVQTGTSRRTPTTMSPQSRPRAGGTTTASPQGTTTTSDPQDATPPR
ncbi:hypothetical protein [Sphingomonas sp.]|uniref:hypothetical protein n=1 Tax=Sphingomonas sp. TaxID=28214 RepID=UPI0026190220|nr:hypothetical protein [Sphingomonas sp.]MDF2494425.1 hypothetical protein [Sphingomonas sp.]